MSNNVPLNNDFDVRSEERGRTLKKFKYNKMKAMLEEDNDQRKASLD